MCCQAPLFPSFFPCRAVSQLAHRSSGPCCPAQQQPATKAVVPHHVTAARCVRAFRGAPLRLTKQHVLLQSVQYSMHSSFPAPPGDSVEHMSLCRCITLSCATRSSTPGPKHSNTHSLCKTLRHRSAAPSRVACKAAATLPEILQKLVPSINGRSSMHRGSGPEYSKQVMEDESKYILQVCYSLLVMHVAVDAVGKWGNVQPTVHTSRHECGCVSARAISKSRA